MNARDHAAIASTMAEEAQGSFDNDLASVGVAQAAMAQAHALTSVALSLAFPEVAVRDEEVDRGLLDELTGEGRR